MSLTITFTGPATPTTDADGLDVHSLEVCDVEDFPHIYGEVNTDLADEDGTLYYEAQPALDLDDIDVRWATWGYLQEEIAQQILGVSTKTIEDDINRWGGKPFVSILDFPGSDTVLTPEAVKALAADIRRVRASGQEALLLEKLQEDYSDWMAGIYRHFAHAVETTADRGGLVIFY